MPRDQVSLNIKNPAVHKAAAKLAKLQGISITGAVAAALEAALEREESSRRGGNEVQRMEAAARRIAAMPLLDNRSADEILGYGPEGYLVGD
jgi:antitoxin VapB